MASSTKSAPVVMPVDEDAAQETTGRCYFLELARELRDAIYYHVSCDRGIPTRIYSDTMNPDYIIAAILDAPLPSLLLTNRQIHDEYLESIPARSKLVVRLGQEFDTAHPLRLGRNCDREFAVLKDIRKIANLTEWWHAFTHDREFTGEWVDRFEVQELERQARMDGETPSIRLWECLESTVLRYLQPRCHENATVEVIFDMNGSDVDTTEDAQNRRWYAMFHRQTIEQLAARTRTWPEAGNLTIGYRLLTSVMEDAPMEDVEREDYNSRTEFISVLWDLLPTTDIVNYRGFFPKFRGEVVSAHGPAHILDEPRRVLFAPLY